jgi:hypothetical protein
MQLAEAPPKILVLFYAELLVSEEDDKAVHKGVMHFLKLLIAERLGQVDARDFCSDVRRCLV